MLNAESATENICNCSIE